MSSTYSAILGLELIGNSEQGGAWGTTTNRNLGTLLEASIAGMATVVASGTSYTLTSYNGVADERRCAIIKVTGSLAATCNIVCPAATKLYVVYNATTGGQKIVFKTASGTGITINNGAAAFLWCDGTNVYNCISDFKGVVTVADNNFTITGSVDATKVARFEVDGLSTATTRVITIPDANTAMVGTDATQTLSNKSLVDASTLIIGDVDPTQKLQFDVTNLAAATTTIAAFPAMNGDGTLAASSAPLTYAGGAKQTFTHDAVNAGINIAPVAGNPSSPANGDLWHNSTTNRWYARVNGVTYEVAIAGLNADPQGQITGYTVSTATNYEPLLSDAGKMVAMNNSAANTITILANADRAFPINTRIDLMSYGTGQTSIVAATGVTIRSYQGKLKLTGQYSGATLLKIGTNEWVLFGDITL